MSTKRFYRCDWTDDEIEAQVDPSHELRKTLDSVWDFLPLPTADYRFPAACCADAFDGFLRSYLHAMPYKAYLQTAWWKRARLGALERCGHRCQLCNADDPLEVHHR